MGMIAKNRNKRWPRGVVFYAFDNGLNPDQREGIRGAIAILEAETAWRFEQVQRNARAVDRIIFRDNADLLTRTEDTSSSNSSSIGENDCLFDGNRQFINLLQDPSPGHTVHEICHALGMWHEHQRPDRDDFVRIHMDRVLPPPWIRSNFIKVNGLLVGD
jgi:hypothetical protein